MKSILILTMVILAGCAAPKPATIADALTEQQKADCKSEGGCVLMTRLAIYMVAKQTVEQMCGKGDSL